MDRFLRVAGARERCSTLWMMGFSFWEITRRARNDTTYAREERRVGQRTIPADKDSIPAKVECTREERQVAGFSSWAVGPRIMVYSGPIERVQQLGMML